MVRSVFGGSTSEATPDLLDAGLRDTFDKTAERYGVPVNVLRAVAESRKANGPRGERGGRRIGVMGLDTRDYLATGVNALDPAAAIDAEAQTLKAALDGAKGDVPGAVRAKYGEAADDVLARAARLADEYPSADPKALGTATGQIEDKGVLDRTAQGVNLMTGGFIKGVGDAVQGAGDVGAFIEDNFDKSAEDIYARGMLGQPEPAPREEAPNRLVETAQGIREVGQNVQDRGAPDFIEPMKKSVPSGVWYDPSTWSLGDDPSVEGYLAHGLSVFGESLPTLASAWMSGPLTAATVGGLQGAGGADQMARDQIDAWNAQGNLVFRSKVYRDMLMAGVPHAEALAKTKEGAAKWAAALDAPLAAVGGYVTGKLVDPATKILSGQGVLTRAVGRGVIAGVEESIQEVAESTAAGTGFNIGAGAKRDISEGTFADAILSFLPGFVPGAAAGALSRREEVSRETPPPTLGGEPPPSSGDGVPPSGEDATTMPVTETPVSPPPAPKTRGKRAKKVEDAAAPSPPEATADEDGVIEEITPAPGKTPLSDAYKEQPTRGRFAPGQKVFVTTGGKTRNGVVQEHDDGGFVWADEDGVTVDVPQELLDNGEVRVRLDVPPGTPDRPVPPGGAAPAAPAKGLGSLEEAEARLQYVRDQARGGGWTAPLLRARKEAEAAIKRFKGRANAAGAAPDGGDAGTGVGVSAEPGSQPGAGEGAVGPLLPPRAGAGAGAAGAATPAGAGPEGADGAGDAAGPRKGELTGRKRPKELRATITTSDGHPLTVKVTDKGPWDFNTTFPLPDRERLEGQWKEGRQTLVDDEGEEYGPEQLVEVLDKMVNSVLAGHVAVADGEKAIAAVKAGTDKRVKDPAKRIAELEKQVARAQAQIDGAEGALSEAWNDEAIDALMAEAKARAETELRSRGRDLDDGAHLAATSPKNDLPEPTDAQKEAGNYKVGRVSLGGLDLSIENPEGSTRSGKDKGGKAWSVTMKSHYGYIRGTVGKDKDHIDVYVKPGTAELKPSSPVFVVNQVDAKGKFDEHKVMLGFPDVAAAKKGYLENYTPDWNGLGSIEPMSFDEFETWLKRGDTKAPAPKRKPADVRAGMENALKQEAHQAELEESPAEAPAAKGKKSFRDVEMALDRARKAKADYAAFQAIKDDLRAVEKDDPRPQAGGAKGQSAKAAAAEYQERLASWQKRHDARAALLSKINAVMSTFVRDAMQAKGISNGMMVRYSGEAFDGRTGDTNGDAIDGTISHRDGDATAQVHVRRGDILFVTPDDIRDRIELVAPAKKPATALAKDEHPGLVIKSLATGKEETIQPVGTKAPPKGQKALGDNARGHKLYEDERGVRSYVESGIRITETVGIIPGGGITIDEDARGRDFLTAGEWRDKQAGSNPVEKSDSPKPGLHDIRPEYRVVDEIDGFKKGDHVDSDKRAIGPSTIDAVFYSEMFGREIASARVIMGDGKPLILNISELKKRWSAPASRNPEKINTGPQDGQIITFAKETGYASAGEQYRVSHVGKREFTITSVANGSSTTLRMYQWQQGQPTIVSEPETSAKRNPPQAEKQAEKSQFADNKLFTQDKVDAARARLKAKMRSQLNAGLDPEMLGDGLTLAGAYVESGIRSFAAFAKAMVEDLGPAIRPYLLNFWNGIRGWPGLDTDGMTSAATAAEQHAEMMRDAAESANIAGERTDDVPGENQEAPADLPADEGEGAEGGGAVRGDGAGEGEGRAGEGDGASGPRVSSTRGRGGRSGRNRVRGSRAGRGRMGKAGADEAGAGVSGPDEAADGASGRVDAPNIPAVNFKITDEARLGQGTEGEKFRDNIEAIRILKQLEADGGRRATAEEQNRLARYVGWGGMANAFASPTTGEFKPDWKKRGEELRDLLTDEEYRQARRSTPNAHYTSETVVKAMWRAAERLGFKGGLALETSMGTGNFIGLMPESAAAKFIGIEYDSVTARIAAALYPASAVYHTGFHKVPLPDNTFALAIGNPPFGKNSLRFQYRPELAGVSIHNQFFRAAMDAVRPGGLQIMVVSRYLMDAKDGTSRRALAHDADLVAAIRLPDTAFKENARTEVVTDIIILKKLGGEAAKERADAFAATTEKPERERDKEQARQARAARIPDWVNTTEIDDPLGGAKITVNSYFAANPGQIIGTLERSGSMAAGEDVTVRLGAAVERGKMTQAERDAHDAAVAAEMAARLNAAVDRLPENIHSLDAEVMAATEARFKSLADGLRIALGGLEPGHIAIDADGKLTRIIEQETPEGQLQFSKQALTAESPWSEQLSQDDKGRWYRMVETFDEKGVKRKVLDEQGRPTRSNLYERQTFENEADVPPTLRLGAAKFEKLKALVRLRDTLKRQLVLESTDAAESLQEENRARLRKGYEAFVAKHGPVNRLTNIAIHASMPDSGLISALEVKYEPERSKEATEKAGLDPQPETVVPAPILTSRVVPKYVPVTSAANATDALSITLSEFGRVNLDRMAQLTGKSPDEVTTELQKGEKPLIYFDPEEGEWQTADAYLSGLVRRKLEAAREAGLEKNIAALEPIQPKPWTADMVTALLGSTWVPTKHYEAFVQHLLGGRATVRFYPLTNLFTVETHGASDPEQWRTEDASAEWLVTRILNSQKIVVFDVDRDGNKHVNHDGTALANIKAEEIRNEFADWVYKDSDRRNELVDIFNDKFNVRVNRQHDGSHLTLVGKNPNIQMRRHQNNAIWRGISERFMLVDHVVGAGKTFTAIGRAMERRRMGLSKKPMIVVPNHLVEQWESDVYRLYPGAKVLAAGKKDFDPKRRRRLFAKIATGDWDIVIVPHSSFGFIGISPETEQRYLDAEYQIALEAVKEAEDQAAADGFSGRGKPLGVKQAEALVAAIEARLDKLREGARDRLLTFEQMGVDDLTIDEAHEFKNLFYTSKMSEARGMGPRAGSRKAADLYNKVRVIRETKTGTVTFMTGTPISNSAVEMYTMMRYLAADQLKDQGLEHFDAWRVQYVDASTAFEPNDSGGGLKEVSRLGRNWANMRSLMDLYYQFTDAVTNDDIKRWYKEDTGLDFPIPAIKGGERQLVKVEPTPAQVDWLLQLISDFDDLPNIADPNARNAERLRLMDRARKISLDIRAVEPTHPSKEEGGKLDQVADNVKRIYAASTPDKGTQLIFVDRGVPRSRGDDKIIASYDRVIARRDAALQKGDEAAYEEALEDLEKFNANEIEELRIAQRGGWNAYAQIKKNLIARGVPEKEIRFVQEADNDEQKAALFEAVRQGKVRVLLGSTPKMGAGTNVQDRLVALHHVDVTWKPSDIEQREGRIIRQGNLFATPTLPDGSANPMFKPGFEAEILAYATERTVDAKMWTLNATKLRMINGIRKYDGEFTMEFEDEESASMAEMAAMATGDVRLIERVQLESAINKLALQENTHRRKLWGMQGEFERAQKTLEQAAPTTARETAFRDMLAAGLKEREAHYAGRSIEVEGKRFAFTDRTKAAEAVEGAIGEAQAAILAQRGPEGKGRYSVNIGGRQFTNEESIINAIEEALGDVTPFLAEIGGRKYGSRTLAARAIAHTVSQRKGNVPAAVGEEVIVPLGSYLGVPLTAGMSRTINQKGAPAIEVYLMLGEDRQRRIAESKESTFHSDLEWSTSAAKSLLDDIDRRAGYRASGAALRDTLGDIDRAKATIEELKDKAHEPFPKAEEISQKRARLKELIAELDTSTPRANAAHHGQAPDDTDDTDDDIAHAQTAPAGWEVVEPTPQKRFTAAELDAGLRKGPLGRIIGRLIDEGTLAVQDTFQGSGQYMAGTLRGYATPQGHIAVIADTALSIDEARRTVLHEAFHAGVRGLLGRREFEVLIDRMRQIVGGAVDRMAANHGKGAPSDAFWADMWSTVRHYPLEQMFEEAAAFSINNVDRAPAGLKETINRIIGMVKAWVLARFGKQIGDVTPQELRALAILAIRDRWRPGVEHKMEHYADLGLIRAQIDTEPTPSPEDDRRADLTLRERIAAATTEAMAPALATIPLRPLLSEMGRGIPAFGKYLDAKQGMDAMRNEWHAKIDALAQSWLKFRVFNRHANTALMDLMHMSTIADVDPTRPFESYMTADDHETLRRPRRENDVPDIAWDIARNKQRTDQRRREAYPGLRRQYDALPADAKTLYGETRDMLRELADEQERLIIENARNALENGVREAEREHSRRILEIDEEGLTGRARAQAIAQADEDLHYARNEGRWVRRNRIRELRKKLEKNRIKGPYFPLARFGDYFVTVRDEEDRVESFSKFESRAEQLRFTKELEAEGVDPERVSIGVMSQAEQVRAQVDPQFVADVVEILRESGTDRVLEDAIWQSYLERLPDMSIRKARIHRKGRAGFNEDALRSFANHMFHGAHQNARLKYVPDLAEWLEVAREEARAVNDDEGQIRAELLVNELEHRHAYILNPAGSPLAQTLTQAGFIWHIAMSPASAAVNLSQTFTLGIPALASNHAGAGNGTAESTALAIKELGRAMKDFTFASRPVRTLRQRLGRAIDAAPGMEHSGRLDVDEKAAMHEFYALGLGDRTQGHDLAGIAETGIQYSALRASVMAKVSWAFHKAEVFNREVTFLAAYRMARQRGLDHPLAIDDAAKVTWKAHFDYQNTSRPRIMQGNTARVLLLFKNYSVNMLFRLIWDTKQAFNGKITPDERREAKIQLFGTTMALMATAGIRGTWVMAVVLPLLFGLVFGAGDDDDTSLGEVAIAPLTLLKRLAFGADDHDAEVMRRELMEVLPSWIVGPIMDGMPGYVTGTDLAERVGSGDLWFRAPDRVLEGEDAVAYWLEQILGPVIGIGVNAGKFVFDPPDNLERGFETVLPKALRDIVRGFRYMIDGAETMKGEPIIEDMSPGQWVAQALGFMPAQLAERYRQNSVSKNREKAIMDRRSGLLGDIWDHVGAGEEVPQSVWDDIAKFNAQYPDYPINGKSIKASIAGHQRARANNSGGIVLNQKIERRILEEAAPGTYD